ncbi:MAG TPA: CehA/McbA family metallohydrolase [Labilithrix sp.]|nr:CehA/McbA family metallohydrolase [Labilithrix sp.]
MDAALHHQGPSRVLPLLLVIGLLVAGCRRHTASSRGSEDSAATPAIGKAALPLPGPFLKGQLHVHTNRSADSETPPESVARWYASRGYDFIVFTDHNRTTDTADPVGMLTLRGVELTQNLRACAPPPAAGLHCLLHVNALFVKSAADVDIPSASDRPERVARYAKALELTETLGGIAQLNHPNFHYAADADTLVALAARGLALVEIANMAVDSANEGDRAHPSTEALWDAALTRGARLFASATDDAHHYDDAASVRARGETAFVGDLGFVMVRAEKTERSIREAIARGDFYATTGVLLDRLDLGPEAITVDVHADSARPPLIELIGPGGDVLWHESATAVRLVPRDLVPSSGRTRYARVRITDPSGRQAFSQPVWL